MTDIGIDWLAMTGLNDLPRTTPILAKTYRQFEQYLREHPEIDPVGARFIGHPMNLRGMKGLTLHVLPGWDKGRPHMVSVYEQAAADAGVEWREV